MALILPSRFTKQPQYPAPIDVSNPIARKLMPDGFAYTPFLSLNKGVLSPPQYTAGVVKEAGSQGMSMVIASTLNQYGLTVASGIDLSFQTGGCTLIVVCDGITPAGGISQGFLGISSSNFFGYNTTGFPKITVGGADQAVSSVAMTPGKRHVIAYSYHRGVIAKVYVDGVLTASATAGSVGIDYVPTLFGHTTAVTTHGTQNIYGGFLFPRTILSDAEVAQVSSNPWQLFKAPTRKYWPGFTTGGATVISLNASSFNIADNAIQNALALSMDSRSFLNSPEQIQSRLSPQLSSAALNQSGEDVSSRLFAGLGSAAFNFSAKQISILKSTIIDLGAATFGFFAHAISTAAGAAFQILRRGRSRFRTLFD